jgi:hypothetical protein
MDMSEEVILKRGIQNPAVGKIAQDAHERTR